MVRLAFQICNFHFSFFNLQCSNASQGKVRVSTQTTETQTPEAKAVENRFGLHPCGAV
jgi:hypothetical protein